MLDVVKRKMANTNNPFLDFPATDLVNEDIADISPKTCRKLKALETIKL
jgi:hypothetical protein